jgi:hypothetical protein
VDSALQQRGHTEKLWCPIRRSPDQRLAGLFIAQLWKQKFAARDCGRDAQRIVSKTREDRLLRPLLGVQAAEISCYFRHWEITPVCKTSDLRSAGARALDGAPASGSAVTASSGYPIKKKAKVALRDVRSTSTPARPVSANSGHSQTVRRRGQVDPLLPFEIGLVKGREAPESGLRLKAQRANRRSRRWPVCRCPSISPLTTLLCSTRRG